MSVAEMKSIIKSKIDLMPDAQVEKAFSKIIEAIEPENKSPIELDTIVPGIFDKFDALMKKLA